MFFMKNLCIKKLNIDEFYEIYQDMETQFPKNELKSYDVFVKLLNTDVLDCVGVYDKDYLVAYFLYVSLKNGRKWLEYIAVRKEFHSKGYGSKIMQCLKNCYLEVEKPNISLPDTIRRIDFYKALGAKKLGVNYIYPNDFGGLPMDLYYIGENSPCYEEVIGVIEEIFNKLHSDVKSMPQILQSIKLS